MQRTYELWRDEAMNAAAWHTVNDHCFAHFHSSLEVAYVESGTLTAVQNGVSHTVESDGLIVNSCYAVHSYQTPESCKSIVTIIPLLVVPSLRATLEQNHFAKGVIDARGMKECRRILRMMADPAHRANQRFVNSLSEALLALLIQKIGLIPNVSDAESNLVKRILIYLRQHAAEELSVDGVAAHFGYSTGRFSHIFNEKIGCSLPRYVNSLRCQQAEALLSKGDAPLTEVAAQCGFSSLRTFHRVYREYAGRTPKG